MGNVHRQWLRIYAPSELGCRSSRLTPARSPLPHKLCDLVLFIGSHLSPRQLPSTVGRSLPQFAPLPVFSWLPLNGGLSPQVDAHAGRTAEGPLSSGPSKPRQRPTLPQGCPCSTIGPEKLNFRVRDGNGCDLSGIAARKKYDEVRSSAGLRGQRVSQTSTQCECDRSTVKETITSMCLRWVRSIADGFDLLPARLELHELLLRRTSRSFDSPTTELLPVPALGK